MDDLKFESMRYPHIPAVLEIEKDAFTTPWTAEMFRQEVEDNQLSRSYVVTAGGRLAGYFVAWFLQGEVHLLNIAVAARYQRRGIGRRMLLYLFELAAMEQKEMITLEVRESNQGAIGLYKSFGFAPVGIRREYYHDDKENALLMARLVPRPGEEI
jgi:ribosomal-protein-alanine N-acetyltransferase